MIIAALLVLIGIMLIVSNPLLGFIPGSRIDGSH